MIYTLKPYFSGVISIVKTAFIIWLFFKVDSDTLKITVCLFAILYMSLSYATDLIITFLMQADFQSREGLIEVKKAIAKLENNTGLIKELEKESERQVEKDGPMFESMGKEGVLLMYVERIWMILSVAGIIYALN